MGDPFAAQLMAQANRKPRSEHALDNSAGLYALFLMPGSSLPGFSLGNEALIYIGKADGAGGLKTRCHFNGGTRNHSPRKSLAAILRDKLGLRPIRISNPKDGSYKTWALEPQSECILNQWMHANLNVSTIVTEAAAAIEKLRIRQFAPLLNLTDCHLTDDHHRIKSARASIETSFR